MKKKIIKYFRIREIPELYVFGQPEVSVVGIGSDKFDIFRLSDGLVERGWRLNPLQFPSRYVHL